MSQVTDEEWTAYKALHKKRYDSEEDQVRRALFQSAKEKIDAHNMKYERGEVTYTMAINHLADLKEEEFAAMCGSRKLPTLGESNHRTT